MWTFLLDQETSRIIVGAKHWRHLVGSGAELFHPCPGARAYLSYGLAVVCGHEGTTSAMTLLRRCSVRFFGLDNQAYPRAVRQLEVIVLCCFVRLHNLLACMHGSKLGHVLSALLSWGMSPGLRKLHLDICRGRIYGTLGK